MPRALPSGDRLSEFLVLDRIVATGSFSAAARELAVSPSAVSKLITRLEQRVGLSLFDRTSRALRLTVEGETYLAQARRVLDAVNDADASLNSLGAVPGGGFGSMRRRPSGLRCWRRSQRISWRAIRRFESRSSLAMSGSIRSKPATTSWFVSADNATARPRRARSATVAG